MNSSWMRKVDGEAGTHLCGLERLIKSLLPVHESRDLGRQQALCGIWPVPRLAHALFEGLEVIQWHKGEHAQELEDLCVPHVAQQVLVELEGGQLVCREGGQRLAHGMPLWLLLQRWGHTAVVL